MTQLDDPNGTQNSALVIAKSVVTFNAKARDFKQILSKR